CIKHLDMYLTSWPGVRLIVYAMMPSMLASTIQDTFVHIVSANVDFVAAIADGVQEHIDALLRLGARMQVGPAHRRVTGRVTGSVIAVTDRVRARDELGDEEGDARVLALGLRALRVRYQCVQDVVHATNWLYGGFNVITVTISLIRGVVFLYCGVLVTLVLAGKLGDYDYGDIPLRESDGAWLLGWGIMLVGKLVFICAIGQQMSSESSRISDALQTGITRYPDMDPTIEREIQWFIRQIRIQEIRFGAYDLFYFDLKS
ncbi:Gustatory receptor 57, partial [Frankliniella occidentalis]